MSRYWDVEEIEKLIQLLSVHTCIWNPYDPDYTYSKSRNAAFDTIAQTMNIPRDVVKLKYTNLRSQFFRIYRNPAHRNCPKKWIHYDALKFLISCKPDQSSEIEANKNTKKNDEMQADDLKESDSKSIDNNEDSIDKRLYDDMNNVTCDSYTQIKRPRSETPDLKIHNPYRCKRKPRTIVMKASTREKDIHAIFGKHVANELRLLKNQKHLQQTLKCEILKAIYDVNKSLLM